MANEPQQAVEEKSERKDSPSKPNPAKKEPTPEGTTEQTEKPTGAENPEGEEPEIQKAEFEKFDSPESNGAPEKKIEMLMDVELPVTVELGRTRMFIKEILELERGTIIELDKMAGEAVDLYINNKKMAEGEVVVVDKHFGVRITNLITPSDRIKSLGNIS